MLDERRDGHQRLLPWAMNRPRAPHRPKVSRRRGKGCLMVEISVDGRRARLVGGKWRGDRLIARLAESAMGGFPLEAQMGDAEVLAARFVAEHLGGRVVRMSRAHDREPIDRNAVQ